MKKRTIWSIAIAMGIALAALIGTQFYYLNEVVETRRKQFDVNVKRALYRQLAIWNSVRWKPTSKRNCSPMSLCTASK